MASLKPKASVPATGALLAAGCLWGCSAASETGRIELELYDQPVECDPATDACRSAETGAPVRPETLRSWVLVSPEISRWDPDGLFVYFELQRPSGAIASVELDVSRLSGATTQARYVELEGGSPVFESEAGSGRVEVPRDAMGDDCDCADGRFELVFDDAGPDGVRGTTDDRVRRLSRARFGWEAACVPAGVLPVASQHVEVFVVDRCPATESPPEPAPEPARDPYEPTDDASCSSDSSSDSGSCDSGDSSSGDSGCGGDSGGGGCEGDSGGGGCEGDSGGGGCSGDSGGGCSGDARALRTGDRDVVGAAVWTLPRRCRTVLSSGRFQLAAFVGLALWRLRRRARGAARPPRRRDRELV